MTLTARDVMSKNVVCVPKTMRLEKLMASPMGITLETRLSTGLDLRASVIAARRRIVPGPG